MAMANARPHLAGAWFVEDAPESWIPESMAGSRSSSAVEDGGGLPSWGDIASVGEGLMAKLAPKKSVRRVSTFGSTAPNVNVPGLGEKLEAMAENLPENETEAQQRTAVSVLLVIQTDVFQHVVVMGKANGQKHGNLEAHVREALTDIDWVPRYDQIRISDGEHFRIREEQCEMSVRVTFYATADPGPMAPPAKALAAGLIGQSRDPSSRLRTATQSLFEIVNAQLEAISVKGQEGFSPTKTAPLSPAKTEPPSSVWGGVSQGKTAGLDATDRVGEQRGERASAVHPPRSVPRRGGGGRGGRGASGGGEVPGRREH